MQANPRCLEPAGAMSETSSSVDEGLDRRSLTWVYHPAARAPARLALAAGVMTLTALTILVVDGSFVYALLSVAFIVWAISPFLFPTRYTLSDRGIVRSSPFGSRHRPWSELRRWQEDRNGFLVSPFRRPTALDDLRGFYLRGGERAAIRTVLEAHLGASAALPGSAGVGTKNLRDGT